SGLSGAGKSARGNNNHKDYIMAAPKEPAAKATATNAPATPKAPAAKAAAAKPAAARKAPAAKAAAVKTPASKTTAIATKYSKTQMVAEIAEVTGLTRKDVNAVMDELSSIIERHNRKRGDGEFTIPGLLKVKSVKKPPQEARRGAPNPFRPGETMDVAAKRDSTQVKVLPLKKLKDMAM